METLWVSVTLLGRHSSFLVPAKVGTVRFRFKFGLFLLLQVILPAWGKIKQTLKYKSPCHNDKCRCICQLIIKHTILTGYKLRNWCRQYWHTILFAEFHGIFRGFELNRHIWKWITASHRKRNILNSYLVIIIGKTFYKCFRVEIPVKLGTKIIKKCT